MYASKSNSPFFVKTGAVFVIHGLSGVMNRASICHIKKTYCSWETWQAALACWCSPAGQLGCRELMCYSNMGCTSRAFTQDSSEAPLPGSQSGTAFPLGAARLAWCSSLLQEEPPEGLCCQLYLIKVVCGHLGALELPGCILLNFPLPLKKPLLLTVCAMLKARRGLRDCLLFRNSLLNCIRFWLYQKV